uniref:Putative ovule protein n=1 Tax=Solanum chacoense TaxID=4108 RepID=A0A0V0I0M3_SOLCH
MKQNWWRSHTSKLQFNNSNCNPKLQLRRDVHNTCFNHLLSFISIRQRNSNYKQKGLILWFIPSCDHFSQKQQPN